MAKNIANFKIIILSILIICSVSLILYISKQNNIFAQQSVPILQGKPEAIEYKGKNGIDALTLLKQYSVVKQNNSGLVISINGRETDSAKNEFWAFYINGKIADIGPSLYSTQDRDVIQWKIEAF